MLEGMKVISRIVNKLLSKLASKLDTRVASMARKDRKDKYQNLDLFGFSMSYSRSSQIIEFRSFLPPIPRV